MVIRFRGTAACSLKRTETRPHAPCGATAKKTLWLTQRAMASHVFWDVSRLHEHRRINKTIIPGVIILSGRRARSSACHWLTIDGRRSPSWAIAILEIRIRPPRIDFWQDKGEVNNKYKVLPPENENEGDFLIFFLKRVLHWGVFESKSHKVSFCYGTPQRTSVENWLIEAGDWMIAFTLSQSEHSDGLHDNKCTAAEVSIQCLLFFNLCRKLLSSCWFWQSSALPASVTICPKQMGYF